MPSNLVLAEVGLSAEEIRTALRAHGCAPAPASAPEPQPAPRYCCGDQKRVWARVRQSERCMVALALMGYNATVIAAIVGVSGECVLRRLRPVGLAKPRGRPRLPTPRTGKASRKLPRKPYSTAQPADGLAA